MDKKNIIYQPTLLDPNTQTGRSELNSIRKKFQPTEIDTYVSQLIELFQAKHPKEKNDQGRLHDFIDSFSKTREFENLGTWVFYPWKNSLVHILPKAEFHFVRTCRNNPLILPSEQTRMYEQCIGVVGLSVGNSVALSLAYSGIGNHYKLADFDTLELSNLNRVRTSILDLGLPKAIITARAIYEIDPYSRVEIFSDGISADNIKDFFQKGKKIDLLFDECDTLMLKFFLRLSARALKIPLFMASDVGYKAEISILAFDHDENAGGMKGVPFVTFDDVIMGLKHAEPLDLSETEKVLLICELLGVENITDEMKDALIKKNQDEIVSYPQLGAIAFIGGGLSALAVLAKEKYPKLVKSTSSFHFMDAIIPPLPSHLKQRDERTKKFLKIFGLEA